MVDDRIAAVDQRVGNNAVMLEKPVGGGVDHLIFVVHTVLKRRQVLHRQRLHQQGRVRIHKIGGTPGGQIDLFRGQGDIADVGVGDVDMGEGHVQLTAGDQGLYLRARGLDDAQGHIGKCAAEGGQYRGEQALGQIGRRAHRQLAPAALRRLPQVQQQRVFLHRGTGQVLVVQLTGGAELQRTALVVEEGHAQLCLQLLHSFCQAGL